MRGGRGGKKRGSKGEGSIQEVGMKGGMWDSQGARKEKLGRNTVHNIKA